MAAPAASSSSFGRAQRLPVRFAWTVIAIHAALFVLGMVLQLLPTSPNSDQMRGVYAQPGVWIPLLSRTMTGDVAPPSPPPTPPRAFP